MKTIREQAEARRQTKLNAIRRQVKTGKLVVRQMTAEERAQASTAPSSDTQGRRP